MSNFITELSGSLIFSNDSGSARINPQFSALAITGALNVSGSDITHNGTSLITRLETLEAGSVGVSLLGLNQHSASVNTFTGSASNRLDSLQAASSSYLTSAPAGTVSSSAQIESLGFITSSGVSSYTELTNIPSGIVSSSVQIENLGFVTSSGDLSQLNTFTGSASSRLDSLQAATSSYITSIPAGTISSSAQIDALGFVTSSTAETGSLITTASVSSNVITFTKGNSSTFSITVDTGSNGGGSGDVGTLNEHSASINLFTGSAATTGSNVFTGSQVFSGSLLPEANGTNNGIHDLGSLSKPWKDLYLTTASLKFVRDGQLVSQISGEPDAIRVGNILITTSSISVVSGSGSSLTVVQNVVSASVSSSGEVQSTSQVLSTDFDGNRIISNEDLGDLFSNNFNAGTSGSVVDFLNALFFPNSAPSITTGNQAIAEFSGSGSTITTVAGTDPEGQSLTFGLGAGYTDDFVRVASDGVMTLNTLATASMNTDNRGDGTLAHPIVLTATDTFNSVTSKTIYLRIIPNTAPVFRETSVSGNIITSFSQNRNESAIPEEVTKIYFTDSENDSITITSASDANNHFIFQRTGSYVRLLQNTSSLDYETTASYSLSLTASDEHSVSGDDGDSFTTLPVTITVVDNATPTINNQVLTGVTESSNAGTVAGTVSAADSEGNTLTFTNFTLAGLQLDGSNISLGTYSGNNQASDPHEDAFNMASNGQVTRKNGVYLNSDLINTYIYSASVSDPYNVKVSASITIPIANDLPATLTKNSPFYIIESATSGSFATSNTSGIVGIASTRADYDANQSVTFEINPTSSFAINSDGEITVSRNISGSSDVGGVSLNGSVTASNSFGTITTDTFSVSITNNSGPTITATPTTANLNTNGARPSNNLYTLTFSDPEGDGINLDTFSASFGGSALSSSKSGGQVAITPTTNLTSGNYHFTASVQDNNGFETTTLITSFSIAQADDGTLTTNGTFYIIESAENNDLIYINSNGRTGTQGYLGVTYSPQYNSAAVSSFTSSNSSIIIASNGNLSIGVNISGSSTGSADTITSDITFRDQYDNIGSGSITVNVTLNAQPTGSFTNQSDNFNTNLATSNIVMISSSITDAESDTPFIYTLTGTNASDFNVVPQNANTSSVNITAASDLTAGEYLFTASITDNFGKNRQYGRSITIDQADTGTLTTNGTFYIIESSVLGDNIVLSSNGRTGTQGDIGVTYSPNYGSQAVNSFTSSNNLIAVDSSGNLTLGANLSGSGTGSGDSISSDITFRDQYDNIGSGSITINVTTNNAPDITFTDTTANLNTNLARSGSTIVTLTFSDTEGDTIDYSGVTFNNLGSQLNAIRSGTSWLIQASENLSGSTYTYSASVEDTHRFRTNTEIDSFTIVQADTGTLGASGTFYVIESATANDPVVTNSNGRTGTTGSLSISYSPNYGTQAVTSFTSSNSQINIASNGNITLGENISGSGTGSGDTISSNITFRDQYDNIGSGSITINVTENAAPTVVSFTDIPSNWTSSIAQGTGLVSMSISDTEGNTPFSASLSGANGGDLQIHYQNADSSSAVIQAGTTLGGGSLTYNVTVFDNFNKSTSYTGRTITVAAQKALIYGYGINWAANPSSELAFLGTSGDTGGNETDINSGSVIAHFQSGSLGSTFTTSYGAAATVTKYFSGSLGDDLSDSDSNGVSTFDRFNFSSGGAQHVAILFPSASYLESKPKTMYDGVPPDSSGTDLEFYLYAKDASIPGTVSSGIYYFNTENAVEGYSRWGMIFTEGKNTNNSRYFLMPDSASAP